MASIEREVENALLNVVSGVTGMNFFTRERGTARTMPSVTVQAQIGSEELVPFSGVFKTPASITYVARADTTARADFDAKFYDILEQLYRSPDLASYLTTNSNITFYVAKVTGDSPAVISQNRTWNKIITMDIITTAQKASIEVPSPLAFYGFNNNSQSVPSNTYELTNINLTPYGTGKINQCAIFDNSSNQGFADDGYLLPSLTTFTITAWIKATTDLANYKVIASKWDGDRGWNFFFGMYPNGNLVLDVGNGDGSGSGGVIGGSVCDGNWHFVVAQCSPAGGFYRVKIDNGSWTSESISATPQSSIQPFQVGSNPEQGVPNFDGSIDALGIWESILTDAEITSLWNNGKGMEIT